MPRLLLAFVLLATGTTGHAQRGPAARLVREVTLADESVPNGFTRIGTVLAGPGGRIYVEQPQDNVIQMFDSAGRYVKRIGGRGQGPGETGALGGIGFLGDTLWTYDFRARRLAFFSVDGTYLSTRSSPVIIDDGVDGRAVSIAGTTPLAGGNFYFAGFSYTSRIGAQLTPPIARLVGTPDGRILDTVALTDSIGRGSFGFASGTRQSFTNDPMFAPLFDRSTLVAVGGQGSWFAVARREDCATAARFAVARMSLQGDTLWETTIDCPRVAVPRGFVDSVVAVNRDRAVSALSIAPGYAESQIRPSLGNPQWFTAVRAIQVGNDGSIWIRPTRAAGDNAEVWVRADAPANAPLHFALAPRAQLKGIVDASRIWVMELDEDDLPTLMRYRVVR